MYSGCMIYCYIVNSEYNKLDNLRYKLPCYFLSTNTRNLLLSQLFTQLVHNHKYIHTHVAVSEALNGVCSELQ